jgi:peroxiredoxin
MKGIVLSILLLLVNGFIDIAVVNASENEPNVPITQDIENISNNDRALKWQFRDLEDATFELGQFKGKVIFINIWATWCMPCTYEMQSIQKLYEAFKKEDVVFLIASNENKDTVKKFCEEKKYTFPIYIIDPQLPEPFQSPTIPSTFIIDRKGKIVLHRTQTEDWNQQSCHEFIRGLIANKDSSKIARPFPNSNLMTAEMMKEQQLMFARSLAESRIKPFIERSNLSSDTGAKLMDIRIEEQAKIMDLNMGSNTSSNQMYEMNKISSDSDEKIFKLLSAEKYGEYQRYKKYENEWVTVSQINKEFRFHGFPLEKKQEEQLVAAMYNDTQKMMAKQAQEFQQGKRQASQSQEEMMKESLEYQSTIYNMYIDSAKNILTEPQLHQFERYFDNQIYMIEKSLIDRLQ